jgi:hypoxanthine-guanine phosphoribosyltransferase
VDTIQIENKTFRLAIPEKVIQQAVDSIALRMNKELADKTPLFISLLTEKLQQ